MFSGPGFSGSVNMSGAGPMPIDLGGLLSGIFRPPPIGHP